ncbi:MAG: phosphatase PAP2 family protein [Candidatus Woesearchaeota archaeon]
MKQWLEELISDTTALGGLPIYLMITALFAVAGKWIVFSQLLLGLVAVYAAKAITSTFWFRKRPEKRVYTNLFERIDAASFPSVHSARSVVLGILVAALLQNILANLLIAGGVIAVGVTRIWLRKHYWSDIIVGWAYGAVIGLLLLKLTPFLF